MITQCHALNCLPLLQSLSFFSFSSSSNTLAVLAKRKAADKEAAPRRGRWIHHGRGDDTHTHTGWARPLWFPCARDDAHPLC